MSVCCQLWYLHGRPSSSLVLCLNSTSPQKSAAGLYLRGAQLPLEVRNMAIKFLNNSQNRGQTEGWDKETPLKHSTLSSVCGEISIINTIFPRWCFSRMTTAACRDGGGGKRLSRDARKRQLAQRVEASLVCLPQSLRTLKTLPDSHMLTSLPLTHSRVGEGRRAVHSKKGLFCVRSAIGRHPHFNALLYTCQRESMSSACLPWMPAKPNRNPFNFQIVECLHTHTPRDTTTYTHVKGNVLLWVHFPIPLSLCITRPHAHSNPYKNARTHARITEVKF